MSLVNLFIGRTTNASGELLQWRPAPDRKPVAGSKKFVDFAEHLANRFLCQQHWPESEFANTNLAVNASETLHHQKVSADHLQSLESNGHSTRIQEFQMKNSQQKAKNVVEDSWQRIALAVFESIKAKIAFRLI